MPTTELSNRIGDFVQYTKMSARKFALECGLSQPTFDKHIRGTAQPNAVTLMGIAKRFPELSLDWLLLGKGDMLKKDSGIDEVETRHTERLLKLVDTIATLQDTINAKNEAIGTLTERIKQLEAQLNK